MKKLISAVLVLVMLAAAFSLNGAGITAFAAEDYKTADINGDGTINAGDALLALKSAVGQTELTDAQLTAADVNGDGTVNSSDALFILQISVGIKKESDLIKIEIDYSSYPTLDPKWIDTVVGNYKEFISEVSADSSKIPIIVSSDQHGTVTEDCEVFKLINDIADWNRISKIINLGDTVQLTYSKKELKAYNTAMKYIPEEKRLELFGNHDGHISALRRDMGKYFIAPAAVTSEKKDAFAVKDEPFNVRYLAVDPMGYPWTYTSGKINTSQANFIVSELEKNDKCDIVILAHPYLFRDAIIKRDGTTFTGSDYFIGNANKGTDVKQSFLDMLKARKDKTAGVFTDSDGKKHPYDFSGCRGDLLMTLHGHHHTEGYETCSGITEFLFQSFRYNGSEQNEPNCFYFAYIDSEAKKFKCWKNIEGYSAWEIDIA